MPWQNKMSDFNSRMHRLWPKQSSQIIGKKDVPTHVIKTEDEQFEREQAIDVQIEPIIFTANGESSDEENFESSGDET